MFALDKIENSFLIANGVLTISLNNIYCGNDSLINSLFALNLDNTILNTDNKRTKHSDLNNIYLWYCRLSHIGLKFISKLNKDMVLQSFDLWSNDECKPYLLGKVTKSPFTKHSERAIELLDIIHSDVYRPLTVQYIDGYFYFITFTNDFSRYDHMFFIKHKFECFKKLK